MEFVKGHGTGNDFVLIPDLDSRLTLTPEAIARICDRRFGIGGDGTLRVVRCAASDDPHAQGAEFFMDYRNADGSVAEMCGNGIRVVATWLFERGLADPRGTDIATRAGVLHVSSRADGLIEVDMGIPQPAGGEATVALDGADIRVVGVLAPNPHAVAFIGNLDTVGVLDQPPRLEPATAFPDGANVEFVERVGPAHMRMRVHERGVGETLSCGTGACAVAWAARRQPGASDAAEYRVDVLGGSLYVREAADGHVWLIGPATLVAHGHIDSALLAGCA